MPIKSTATSSLGRGTQMQTKNFGVSKATHALAPGPKDDDAAKNNCLQHLSTLICAHDGMVPTDLEEP